MERDVAVSGLPEEYRDIAELIGVRTFLRLCSVRGGNTVYIPKPETLLRRVRDMRIRQEYNADNTRELARRYRLEMRQIRRIVGEG